VQENIVLDFLASQFFLKKLWELEVWMEGFQEKSLRHA